MPVQWSILAPETLEKFVAVLLCRRNPAAKLIRPSKGDGGIDVLVPVGDDKVDVYQVKKFASNLTGSQKGQIEKSLKTLDAHRRDAGLQVANWYLALPLDPTRENLDWLGELAAGMPFPCDWRGLTFLEGLAAEFPAVVDYYVGNGADRLADAIAAVTNALGLAPKADGDGQITPAQLATRLHSLQPVLDTDPHFRYGISLDVAPPNVTQTSPA